jgi:hypothetical protein
MTVNFGGALAIISCVILTPCAGFSQMVNTGPLQGKTAELNPARDLQNAINSVVAV